MQFNFNCEQVLGSNKEGFSILEGSFMKAIKPGHLLYVNEILDTMGQLSSKVIIKIFYNFELIILGPRIEYNNNNLP